MERRLTGLIETFINVSMIYQRNQVVWAVARIISPKPSLAFERDIALKVQRLIDRDRATEIESSQKAMPSLTANCPARERPPPSRRKRHSCFSWDLLLESGFTQARVVRLIRDLKDDLCQQHEWIISQGDNI